MQSDFIQTILTWASALLLYPGLLFALTLALIAEWLFSLLLPLITSRTYRASSPRHSLLQPLYTYLKLSGRRSPARWSPDTPTKFKIQNPKSKITEIAPILALALLPLPGSPLNRPDAPHADLLTILLLLAIGPLAKAASRLLAGDLTSLQGARDLGRLLTGLLPTIVAIAALVQVSGTPTLQLSTLTLAPETAPQSIVRFLAGIVLLASLPWGLDWRDTSPQRDAAATNIGRLVQTAAVSALWTLLIFPTPGDRYWAIALTTLGTLFAYLAMRAVPHIWVPIRREREAASLVWATALPLAALALLISLWTGA